MLPHTDLRQRMRITAREEEGARATEGEGRSVRGDWKEKEEEREEMVRGRGLKEGKEEGKEEVDGG